jgi:hypothetical protein
VLQDLPDTHDIADFVLSIYAVWVVFRVHHTIVSDINWANLG